MLDTKTLRIVQYNVQKSKNKVQAPFINDPVTAPFDVVAIQEPWKNTFGNTSVQAGSVGFDLVYPDREAARTCTYVNKRIDPNHWTATIHGPDLITVSLRTEQGKVNVHNIYLPPPALNRAATERNIAMLDEALKMEGDHVIVGDFNLHHPIWGGDHQRHVHPEAEALLDLLTRHGMELSTPPGARTWEARGSQQTLDLSWHSQGLRQRILTCEVLEELDHSSDHLPVKTVLTATIQTEIRKSRKIWKKADIDGMQTALQGAVSDNPITAAHELERAVADLVEQIQAAASRYVPWAKPSKFSQPYWTSDCSRLVKEARAARKRWEMSRTVTARIEYRRAVNIKGQRIRKAKDAYFKRQLAEAAETDRIWRLARWAKGPARPESTQVPPLRRPDGTTAQTCEEKAETLLNQFFPERSEADISDTKGYIYPEADAAHETVSAEEVQGILKRIKPDKACGEDGIPNRGLLLLSEQISSRLAQIAEACIQLGYCPSHFKTTVTVVLKKPQKDYSEPKSYRPIALLNTIGKVVESTVAGRIVSFLEESGGLPDTQMGARKNRSTISALELLIEQVKTVWDGPKRYGKTQIASMLGLDISGAFDHVAHVRLIHNLRRKRLYHGLVKFVESFLTNRSTSIRFGSYQSETKPIEAGIPQGSILSPILFLVFVADLLEACHDPVKHVSAVGFVDDINIIAYGPDPNRNCTILEETHRKCEEWARRHGAKFAPQKYELIHFHRGKREACKHATLRLGEIVVKPSDSARILGVQIDSALKWSDHIKKIKVKAESAIRSLTRLSTSTWGASMNRARMIYKQVVLPGLIYGSQVWYQPDTIRKGPSRMEKLLQGIERRCLRIITGAYRATPVEMLHQEAKVLPLKLALDRITMRNAEKRQKGPVEDVIKYACSEIEKRAPPRPSLKGKARHMLHADSTWVATNRQEREQAATTERQQQKTWVDRWVQAKWDDSWRNYVEAHRNEAHPALKKVGKAKHLARHANLRKAESSLLTQIRTGRIGLNSFLSSRNVPGYTPSCPCGAPEHTVQHLLVCPRLEASRSDLIRTANTTNLDKLLGTFRGTKALLRWIMEIDVLKQFGLARLEGDSDDPAREEANQAEREGEG